MAALDAFAGLPYPFGPCLTRAGGAGAGLKSPIQTAGTLLTLVRGDPPWGDDRRITVEVWSDALPHVRGYQLALRVSGAAPAGLRLVDAVVDANHPDGAFGRRPALMLRDIADGRIASVLLQGDAFSDTPAYLGTFVFEPSPAAAGIFEISLRAEATLLRRATTELIDWRPEGGLSVDVGAPGATPR